MTGLQNNELILTSRVIAIQRIKTTSFNSGILFPVAVQRCPNTTIAYILFNSYIVSQFNSYRNFFYLF